MHIIWAMSNAWVTMYWILISEWITNNKIKCNNNNYNNIFVLIINLDRTQNDTISITGVEFNCRQLRRAQSRSTSYLTLLLPSEWGLVNLKGNPQVCIPYGARTRFASTNAPDVSYYASDPPHYIENLGCPTVVGLGLKTEGVLGPKNSNVIGISR